MELCCPLLASLSTACVPPHLPPGVCVPPGPAAGRPGPCLGPSPVCKSHLGPPAHCQQGQHEEPAFPVTEAGSQVSRGLTRWPGPDHRKACPSQDTQAHPPVLGLRAGAASLHTPPPGVEGGCCSASSEGAPHPGNKGSLGPGTQCGGRPACREPGEGPENSSRAARMRGGCPQGPLLPLPQRHRGEMPGAARGPSPCLTGVPQPLEATSTPGHTNDTKGSGEKGPPQSPVATCLPTDPRLWAQSRRLGSCHSPKESPRSTSPAQPASPARPRLGDSASKQDQGDALSGSPWVAALMRALDQRSAGLGVFSRVLWVTFRRGVGSRSRTLSTLLLPLSTGPLEGLGFVL